MRNIAQQAELDTFEAAILKAMFGKPELPAWADLILSVKKIDVQKVINTFEDIMEPFLLENGLVNAEAFRKLVAFKYPNMVHILPKVDFRLIEIASHAEPLLKDLKTLFIK